MTKQSTWIPHDPPLKVNEQVRVVSLHSKFLGRIGIISEILDCHSSPCIRTDRWASDWYAVALFDTTEHFLEDELIRTNVHTAEEELAIKQLLTEFASITDDVRRGQMAQYKLYEKLRRATGVDISFENIR